MAASMKLRIKKLDGEQFEVEADPSATVLDLKVVVEAAAPELAPASALKLIFAGRVLDNDASLSECSIKEGDFFVAMASKPKHAAAPKTVATAPCVPVAMSAGRGSRAVALARPTPTPSPTRELATVAEPGAPSSETVESLCAMGFLRADVERCLRLAFNDPDRAVEYLATGVPADLAERPAYSPGSDVALQTEETHAAEPLPADWRGGMGGAPFPMAVPAPPPGPDQEERAQVEAAMAELQNHPRFEELAAVVREDPQMLQHILPALAEENPDLMEVINSHREEFAELLAAPARGRDPGATGFRLAPSDLEAVGRLQQLGFPRAVVVEAYVACSKNEEIAANYLFEHGFDD